MSAEAVQKAVDAGATDSGSTDNVVVGVDAIITMLPTTKDVESVSEIVAAKAKKGAILIDSSTISPIASQKIAKRLSGAGIKMIDAPVSGGVFGAINATLTFMVGGPNDVFEDAKPFLQAMGKNLFLCGENGSGLGAKIVNNYILG
jgi:3-hydroxyisobutyrate dehydrogenase